ncbi:midasin isoform X3 [Acanthopagrus latus]|uniref:midasin isoform X3 n=1 Tax=Acanthopagrus latus TaxID=8177 RepID=UPI00187C7781|nr:midasin isoform X3 [Acanthopagrus latus]
MEQTLSDLLTDAFSETTVPSFPDGDLDFENLNFDEDLEEDKVDLSLKDLPTKEDEALHQEASAQTAVLPSMETKDTYMSKNVDDEPSDEEDFRGGEFKIPEEDYTSSDGDSEQEGSASGEEEEEEEDTGTGEKPGELLESVHCAAEYYSGNKEDRIFAEGQPLAPEGAEHTQVRNEEQGESESDEEESYFERVPERGSEMMTKGDGIEEDEREREEEKEEDSSDSEREGMKIEREENVLEQEVESPQRDAPTKASPEFPEISDQNLQDLIAEVDSEEFAEKMKDFSGEEHQEAGESFADYPSDFSSCEYVEDGGKNQDHPSVPKQEDTDDEAGEEYLYSIDLEVDADRFRGKTEIVEHTLTSEDTSESDSYSSSEEDEVQGKKSDEEPLENVCPRGLGNNNPLEEDEISDVFARWSTAEDSAAFDINWNLDMSTTDTLLSEEPLTTEDPDKAETLLSHVTPRPGEDEKNTYAAVQRGDTIATSPSNQGSLDDGFFFNTELEAFGASELGQLGDDEYEDERNWEQEQERIKAFYEFYDDSDGENGREGRQTRVQFCADPLSQVIRYETDSSDRDSLSSSTDGEEDPSSAETSEELREPDATTQMNPVCDPPDLQLPENVPDLSDTHKITRNHKCLDMLKLTLKMCVVVVTGLLMFWLATDQAGWLSQASFF